jgi:transcriptional antiterminator NusG
MHWYIVNTFSGFENTVKRSIEDQIKSTGLEECFEEILVPSEQVSQRRGKKTIKTQKKFFPGYIFIRMDLTPEAQHLVKNTPKVSGFLGGKNPKPVPQTQMDKMLGKAQPAEVEVEVPTVTYKVGDSVRVKTGAFANFTGDVEEVDQIKKKIWLSVSIFGRPTRVEVEFTEVEPAA